MRLEILLQVHEQERLQSAAIEPAFQVLVLSDPDAALQHRAAPDRDRPRAVARARDVVHLARRVAAENDRTALIQQATHALIVVHAAIDEPNGPSGYNPSRTSGSNNPGTHDDAATALPSG